MKQKSINILRSLQHPRGLFSASKQSVGTGYHRAWIRDNIYEALGLEAIGHYDDVAKTYQALLDILLKHEYKIDWAIKEKPDARYKYIHARYDIETFDEILEEWGNKQNDAVGALLFKIGDLEGSGINVIRNRDDLRIVKKLVRYLESVEYWHDKDNGIWEENEEVHASSVGACVAGLRKIAALVEVPAWLIEEGQMALDSLLPRESVSKETDLALLSLIYPYDVADESQKKLILKNIEINLVRSRGVIRYKDDHYYNNGISEAEWTMGFPWLAIIYKKDKDFRRFWYYMLKTISVINDHGELPELYFGQTGEHNENSPLGWSQALFLVMCRELEKDWIIEALSRVRPFVRGLAVMTERFMDR